MTQPAATAPRSGARRAATLLVLLGDEAAAQVLAHLTPREVEAVGAEIARLEYVDGEEARSVVAEFLEAVPTGLPSGGPERLARLLAASHGADSQRFLERITRSVDGDKPIDVTEVDPASLAVILEAEPPQAVALLVSRLDAKVAGGILARLSPETRRAVASRMAHLDVVDPDTLEQLLGALKLRLESLGQAPAAPQDGVRALATILNHVKSDVSSQVLEDLEKEDADLAERVRQLSVVFEDILFVSDRAMAAFVQRVDKKLLATALKGTTEEIMAKFFRGMSERAGENLREEMQFLGAVRVADVEQAQSGVIAVLKKLIEEGVVVLDKGGDGFVS